MTKTKREYVSAHTYKTPSGMYYNDRTGKRVTARRGHASEASADRMHARVRDDHGKLTFRRIKANSDTRSKAEGKKHTGSPDNADVEADTIYDPAKNEALASEYVERKLNQESTTDSFFNVTFMGWAEEE